MPGAGVRHSGSHNGAASAILTPETSTRCEFESRSGGGSGRGEEAMPHASRRRQALGRSQWRRQHDPDAKDIDGVRWAPFRIDARPSLIEGDEGE
jgi:hypothetical protein